MAFITSQEIAKELGVSNRTVINWINDGKLEGYKLGQSYRVEKEEYDRFIQNAKVNGGKENE